MKWGLLMFLLLPAVYAASLDEATTTAVIEGNEVTVTSNYTIVSERVEDMYVQLPKDTKEVSATVDGLPRQCTIKKSIAFCGSIDNEQHSFTIEYKTRESIGMLGDRYVFRFTEYLPFRTKNHTFVLKLPVGAIIPKEEGKDPDFFLTPNPKEELSDGQRIIIKWVAENTNAVSVSAVVQPLNQRPSINWAFIASVTGGIIIAAALSIIMTRVHLKSKQKKPKKPSKPKELVPQFIEHERMVVDLLSKAQNNEMWQKQLLAETKFSKAKLSRIIRNLESRGVVKKTIFGNTNKISLKK